MTRQQLNPIAMILLTVSIVAVKSLYYPNLADEHHFYYLILVAIATVVSGFEVVKFIYTHRHSQIQGQRQKMPSAPHQARRVTQPSANQRDAYRLIYPPESRPILEVQQAPFDHLIEHNLVIYDLSETGLGFHHDGLLPLSGTLLGRIRFNDGEYLEVAGDVVHHRHDRVGLALHCYIPHARFMEEQRRLITRHKPNRLNLEVMRRSAGSGRSSLSGRSMMSDRIRHPDLASGCPCRHPRG
jgi:hypothetical protein